jgi:methyl-accepting chemotaxis protein
MSSGSSIKIGARLGLAFGAVLLITAAIAGIGIWRLGTLKAAANDLATLEMERSTLAARWSANINLNWVRTSAALFAADAGYVKALQADMDATSKLIGDTQKQLEPLITDARGKEILAEIGKARETYRGPRGELMKKKLAGEDVAEAVKSNLQPLAAVYLDALDKLDKHMDAMLAASLVDTNAVARTGQWMLGLGAALSLVLGLGFAIVATRAITGPIGQAVGSAQAISDGDLAVRIDAKGSDESAQMLQALLAMRDKLAHIVGEVRENAEGVSTASAEIAQGNHDLSARTEMQASAIQQTAASMEELSATVKQNAENARQANQMAVTASSVAIQAGDVVNEVVETMKGINDSSKRIADIITVIDGIAFQTNILALNAAVEAARAGEQGRGFAVVASEVRSLAGRSAEAAKEIKSLISTSVERVELGSALVDRAGVTMTEVVASIQKVTHIMGEISAASSEQSSGVAQIGTAVQQMDQVTQQNSALVEEMAAAASSLRTQAQALVQVMSIFKLADRRGLR